MNATPANRFWPLWLRFCPRNQSDPEFFALLCFKRTGNKDPDATRMKMQQGSKCNDDSQCPLHPLQCSVAFRSRGPNSRTCVLVFLVLPIEYFSSIPCYAPKIQITSTAHSLIKNYHRIASNPLYGIGWNILWHMTPFNPFSVALWPRGPNSSVCDAF